MEFARLCFWREENAFADDAKLCAAAAERHAYSLQILVYSLHKGKKKLAYPLHSTNSQIFKVLKMNYLIVELGGSPNISW
jgi:hypothetical protein